MVDVFEFWRLLVGLSIWTFHAQAQTVAPSRPFVSGYAEPVHTTPAPAPSAHADSRTRINGRRQAIVTGRPHLRGERENTQKIPNTIATRWTFLGESSPPPAT